MIPIRDHERLFLDLEEQIWKAESSLASTKDYRSAALLKRRLDELQVTSKNVIESSIRSAREELKTSLLFPVGSLLARELSNQSPARFGSTCSTCGLSFGWESMTVVREIVRPYAEIRSTCRSCDARSGLLPPIERREAVTHPARRAFLEARERSWREEIERERGSLVQVREPWSSPGLLVLRSSDQLAERDVDLVVDLVHRLTSAPEKVRLWDRDRIEAWRGYRSLPRSFTVLAPIDISKRTR